MNVLSRLTPSLSTEFDVVACEVDEEGRVLRIADVVENTAGSKGFCEGQIHFGEVAMLAETVEEIASLVVATVVVLAITVVLSMAGVVSRTAATAVVLADIITLLLAALVVVVATVVDEDVLVVDVLVVVVVVVAWNSIHSRLRTNCGTMKMAFSGHPLRETSCNG